jgi:hypothetical protein
MDGWMVHIIYSYICAYVTNARNSTNRNGWMVTHMLALEMAIATPLHPCLHLNINHLDQVMHDPELLYRVAASRQLPPSI